MPTALMLRAPLENMLMTPLARRCEDADSTPASDPGVMTDDIAGPPGRSLRARSRDVRAPRESARAGGTLARARTGGNPDRRAISRGRDAAGTHRDRPGGIARGSRRRAGQLDRAVP